jgi:hypothetical protein
MPNGMEKSVRTNPSKNSFAETQSHVSGPELVGKEGKVRKTRFYACVLCLIRIRPWHALDMTYSDLTWIRDLTLT